MFTSRELTACPLGLPLVPAPDSCLAVLLTESVSGGEEGAGEAFGCGVTVA